MADVKSKEDFKDIYEKITSAESVEVVSDIYSRWAGQYDKDLSTHMVYNGPNNAACELASRLNSDKNAYIFDLGAGTGLVATELAKLGFTHIDALDASEAMLGEARKKNLYQQYIHGYIGQALDIPNDTYDALICVGVFVPNHVDETCFDELIRITKPGGYMVFTIADYPEFVIRMDKRISELESLGLCKLLNPGAISESHRITDTGVVHAKLYTLKKCI